MLGTNKVVVVFVVVVDFVVVFVLGVADAMFRPGR